MKFSKISICVFLHTRIRIWMHVSEIQKSRESQTAKNHIFYDLAEFAPPNNPFDNFDNSNPTTPRIGTNLLGSNAVAAEFPRPGVAMEEIRKTQARLVTGPRPRHSLGFSQDVIVLNYSLNPGPAFMNPGFGLSSFRATL